MAHFRRLLTVALLAGTVSGLGSFGIQHLIVVPLIVRAEVDQEAARSGPPIESDRHEWQPSEGFERAAYTAIATVLTGIGYAALLLGAATALNFDLDLKRGLIAGVIAFGCLSLAPAIGLPPQPPGTAVADLHARQAWWIGTVVASAVGLWLLAGGSRSWLQRIVGVLCLCAPHLIGAPLPGEASVVPAALARQFAIASVATSAVFWLLIGATSGYGIQRHQSGASALNSWE